MKSKIKLITLTCIVSLSFGCANIHQSRSYTDDSGRLVTESIRLTSVFSNSALAKFKGNHKTKTTATGIGFDQGETEAQKIEEFGTLFGAAAASAMKKGVGIP